VESKAGSFVCRPGGQVGKWQASFDLLRDGQPLSGLVTLRASTSMPKPRLCVYEYATGADSGMSGWQTIGCFEKRGDFFVGQWNADGVLKNPQSNQGSPCFLRATFISDDGHCNVAAVSPQVVKPPERQKRGCGCH
jgi:hypothetical protein